MGNEEIDKISEQVKAACMAVGASEDLSRECISYVLTQLNEHARLGHITQEQFQLLVSEAEDGLFELVFIKNYTRDLTLLLPVHTAFQNFMRLLFTRVFMGRDRDLAKLEIDARRQLIVQPQR